MRKRLIATALAAATACCLLLTGCGGGGVSEDQVKQEMMQAELMAEGFIDSDYVEDAPYELIDFKVTNQTIDGANKDHSLVEIEGTISNGTLESTFTACADYYKQGEAWIQSNAQLMSVNTIPLKGVDYIAKPTEKDTFTVSEFQSTFEESNGSYTSTATQNVKYEFWFATDTAKNSQTFTFDQQKGWEPLGEVEVSDTATSYTLAGRTFEYADDYYNIGATTAEFTFAEDADPGTLAINYILKCDMPESDYSEENYDVDTSGRATGTPKHEFGVEKFSIDLNDQDGKMVTFQVSNARSSVSAGHGEVNTLSVDIESDIVTTLFTAVFKGSTNTYDLHGAEFTERL